MPYFIASQMPDEKGRHELHETTCYRFPDTNNQIKIGHYANCTDAIRSNQALYPSMKFDGCKYCCSGCHRG